MMFSGSINRFAICSKFYELCGSIATCRIMSVSSVLFALLQQCTRAQSVYLLASF